jgi:predicted N-acetyltransferase YhbS
MQIERIDEVRLTAADEAQISVLIARAYDHDFGGRSYNQQRHHVRILARAPDIIGHMALTYRDIRVADVLTPIYGLAEVATDPDHRGRGIASAMLQAAIAEAKTSPAQFLLLFGDAGLYSAAGFRPATHRLHYTVLNGARTRRTHRLLSRGLMVLPLRDQTWPDGADLDMLGHLF